MTPEKEAMYYEKLDNNVVKCLLCSNYCRISPGKVSPCLGRQNIDGTLYAINYNRTVSIANDPIEKKPLYHFHPGEMIISVAGNSCNFHCIFCQNYSISQSEIPTRSLTSDKLIEIAIQEGSFGIAYTYTEPLTWYEFVLEASRLAHSHNLKNVLVSNGSINPEPFDELAPFIDAMNIDLKSIKPEFYKKYCKSGLDPVKKTIENAYKKGIFLEITNLIIPTLNDSDEELHDLTDYIAGISADIPLHLSAYHPSYKLDIPRTPDKTLKRAYDIASSKLRYVYVGNTSIAGTGNTRCPKCKKTVIERTFFNSKISGLDNSCCKYCGEEINVIR